MAWYVYDSAKHRLWPRRFDNMHEAVGAVSEVERMSYHDVDLELGDVGRVDVTNAGGYTLWEVE